MLTIEKIKALASKMLALSGDLIAASGAQKFEISIKADGSKVTTSDMLADRSIRLYIEQIFGTEVPVLSEEDLFENQQRICGLQKYWIMDPIDGTDCFVKGLPFCSNLAYCENNIPLFGLIVDHHAGDVYFNWHGSVHCYSGSGSLRSVAPLFRDEGDPVSLAVSISVFIKKGSEMLGLVSALHTNGYNLCNIVVAGAAMKYLAVIKGDADIALTFTSLMDWDVAPVMAMAADMGYFIRDGFGKELQLGTGQLRHDNFVLFSCDQKLLGLYGKHC